MRRKLGIQARLIVFLILALLLVTAGLEIVQVAEQRDSLVDAERKRSQALIDSVNAAIQAGSPSSTSLDDMTGLEGRLSSLVEQNDGVDFIAVTGPDGLVIAYSEPGHSGQRIASLAGLPADATVRRDAGDVGPVYITTARFDAPTASGPAPFTIQVGADAEPIDARLLKSLVSSAGIALAAIGLSGVLAVIMLRINVTHPVQTIQAGASRFARGNFDDPIKPQGGLELRILADTLNTMARELKHAREALNTLVRAMEVRVEDRTRDLQLSAEIGRIATSPRHSDALLSETVAQIRQRFDVIYHAQVFLIDNVGRYAVLVESTGDVGQQLLESGHKLPVGSHSVIGQVTARGQTVMASDTLAGDVPWQLNPLLPDTRAEMALPLRIEDRVIGALDVQSRQPDVFTDDMVRIFEVMADQLTIAIENARLLAESDQHVREIDMLNRQLTRGAWQAFSDERGRTPAGYVFDQMRITPLSGDTDSQVTRGIETAIQVHGESIGTLATTLPDSHALSQDDHLLVEAVAERVALAVENARLFQQTQRALAETERLYETARTVSSAPDLETIYTLIVEQLSTGADVDSIAILLAGPEPAHAHYLEIACQWQHAAGNTGAASGERTPLEAGRLGEKNLLPVNAPAMMTDAAHDLAPDHPLYRQLTRMAARSVLLVPLSAAGNWFGLLVCGSRSPGGFDAAYVTFASALADQLAIAIENRRLLLRTAAALEETAILYHASRSIADALTPVEILQTFVHNATARTVHQAALYLLLSETQDSTFAAIEVVATVGDSPVDPVGTRYRMEQFPFKEAFATPDIRFFGDLSQAREEDVPDLMRLACEQLRLQSLTLIPLWAGERPLGLVLIGLQELWAEADTELRVYEALADQAAVSLENSRLYRQAQRRARQLSTSAEISRAVTSILHLDDLLPQVVTLIRDSFEYDHAQIFLLSEDGEQANLVASTGEAGQKLLERRHSLPVGSRSVVGQVMATGEPQIALDTADARVIHYPNPLLPHTRSEIALPLIARGQILGALDVQSNTSGAFTDVDTRMLASLADMVATAIDNARLFELSEQRAEEMTFLFNVTTAAAASPDLEDSLVQAVETLRDTMNVTSASIYLTDTSGDTLVKGAEVGAASQETALSTIAVDRGLIGWVARHDEAVVIGDMSQDPRRLSRAETPRSAMALPLRSGGDVIGVLAVESDRLNAFDDSDLRLMQTLSGSLATIIHNSRLLSEVQAANEQLLEVDRLKTNFLAAMSHELRTPLNSIIGFSRVILKGIDGPLTETQTQDITTIFDSGKHLLGLVNDILDQAKIEAGKMELSFAYFKLQDVIGSVMSSAVGLTRDKSIRLHSEIADDLPDAYGDEFRTRQVLLNLISNAAKFTEEGSITVTAFPVKEDGSAFIQVSVTDTGIGIAGKDMPKLFEAFQQVDNSLTRRVGGTGMGLPLARSLTELQHGRMWVESQPGTGSTFSILVPTTPMTDERGTEDDTGPHGAAGDDAAASRGMAGTPQPLRTVLVIENTVETINLYRRYLTRDGYEVIGTTHADDVTNMLTLHHPALIVLDVNLQDGAGWDVLEHLKTADATSSIPVVICSLNPDSPRGLAMGATAYLEKPFTEERLLETLQNIDAETGRPPSQPGRPQEKH